MRSSQIVHRPGERPPQTSPRPGHGWLLAGGFVLELGPGLVAGTSLLHRVRERLVACLAETLAGLDAQPVALAATEGEALVNLLVHAGAATSERARRVHAVGAGWREDDETPDGLFGLALHDRLDVASVGAGPQDMDALLGPVGRCLAQLGLDVQAVPLESPGDGGARWRLELELAGAARRLGHACARPLAGPDGPGAAWLDLDVSALLGALAEVHHDERGLCWPAAVAPFDVVVLPAGGSPRDAEKLSDTLHAEGLDVLLEDRALAPADARRDAEQWGLPWRLLVGPAEKGGLVLESRAGGKPERVDPATMLERVGAGADRGREVARRRRLRAAF